MPAQEPTVAQIIKERLRMPDQSVNRGKYSRPYDTLYPRYFSWGILTFPVSVIPDSLSTGDGKLIQFKVTHVPLFNNYAHSEIRAFDGQSHKRQDGLTKAVRKAFRRRIEENTRIIKRSPPP